MNDSSSLPYRKNVCMLVYNEHFKLFLGQRSSDANAWQFPQGGVEEGATLFENALREVEEELGVERRLLSVTMQLQATHRYDFAVTPEYARGKFRGQEQTFWLVRFLGKDSDILLDRHEPEFIGFRWCTAEEVRRYAEPRRLAGYNGPLREFEEFLSRTSLKP